MTPATLASPDPSVEFVLGVVSSGGGVVVVAQSGQVSVFGVTLVSTTGRAGVYPLSVGWTNWPND